MKSKLIKCKDCGADISKNAKTCPHCGAKNKKPIYKRVWFWILMAVMMIGFMGSDTESTENKPVSTVQNIQPTENKETHVPEETEKTVETTVPVETEEKVSAEYLAALVKAKTYSDMMYMSKAAIFNQLTSEYGEKFPEDAAQYAIDNLEADYQENALKKAETYSDMMYMSKKSIFDQLTSEYGEQFTEEEAQYAVDHLEADYFKNALEKAKTYRETMSMSNNAIFDQLTSQYGEKFTKEEAQYAIDNLDK